MILSDALCSLGAVMLILDICQHSYLKNSKSAPVSQYQLWMSLHKCACLPAGKTQKIPELPTQHISIQNRKLNRSFNCAWEIIMENRTKKPTNISVPRESCHLLCPWETAQWYSDWHNFSSRRKSKAQRTLNYRSHWTKHKIQPGGYLLLQDPTCYSIRVSFLLLTEFASVLTSCEDNKDLPQTFNISAA